MAAPTSTTVGPYILQDLVDNLPLDTPAHQNVAITCLESWGSNLYVGTSAHEILHLVSIPSTPNPPSPKPTYIQASRLEPQSTPTTSGSPFIKQIFVLPTVSKALVLSSTGLLTFYTLPEFSPLSKSPKLKDVSYVGGLNLNEEEADLRPSAESSVGRPKLVMALAKNKIRLIRIGEEPRLVKEILLSNTLSAVRRDSIACVATNQNYNMLDIDNIQRIPLFPISATSDSDLPASPVQPSAVEGPGDSNSHLHPPRASSLAVRERRNSSATTSREGSTAATHSRSVSAGNIPPEGSERGSRRPTSRLGQSHLAPDSGTLLALSPGSSSGGRHSPSGGSRATSPAPPPVPPPPPKSPTSRGALKPHIASPSPGEFLLTTGTKSEDPGVGIFVNMEGDVTRGTIQFERYPDQLIVHGGWVIAVIHGKGLDMQRWDLEDEDSVDEADKKGTILLEGEVQLKEVLGLDGTMVAEAGRTLRLVRVPLKPVDGASSELPADQKRNEEERVIAQRISTVQSRVVVFSGPKVWTLLPCPLSVRLNSRLPNFSDENFDSIVARVRRVLHVLHEVQSMEPDSETSFHEVSFVRQKCGLLVLGELLRITQKQTADIAADEILKVESALIESALDPRFIVALFGNAFEEDIVEGDGGVWVYGGVKEVFASLKESKEVGSAFNREVLLLLKRYLAQWRSKKGFGSVADEKEVFSTVDKAMLRVLLMLDSPEYLIDRGQTVVPEGNVRAELYAFIDAGVDDLAGTASILETFGRLYLLSILYSRAKMYSAVLNTWRRILEGEDTSGEFGNGEVRVKNFLHKMRDPELVEEFGCWLATRNAMLGIQVFAAEEARVKFETTKVLEMLRERAPEAVRQYCEYLVIEKKNTAHANELIFLYVDDLTHTLSTDPSAVTALQTSYESYRALYTPKPTYYEFVVDNSPAADSTPWWHNRMRLLELLGGASGYDVAKVFESIKQYRDVLVPEMVILYGRESKHADALKLLTHDLRDFDTAINYCLFGGLSIFQTRDVITDRAEQSELFAVLLDECLKLKNMNERIEQTSQLLEKFGRWLDVTHVLSVIPDDWSVNILGGFLITALRQLVREEAEVKVERALARSKNLRVEAEYVRQCDEIGPVIDLGN